MASPAPKKTELKIKPKAVQRRGQQEREALAREEAQREQIRHRQAAEDEQIDKQARDARYGFVRGSGIRGRGGRFAGRGGRGGYMGESDRDQSVQEAPSAAGPAAAAAVSAGSKAADAPSKTKAPKGKPGRKVKVEADGDTAMANMPPPAAGKIKPESSDPQLISDDDDLDYGKPIDIDLINISDDSDEDKPVGGMLPVRMQRSEHVDRQIGINTESSAATAAGARRGAGVVVLSDGSDNDDNDAVTAPSADAKGKGRRASSTTKPKAQKDPSAPHDADTPVTTDTKPRRKSSHRSKRPTFQTDEERIESEIRDRDSQVLRQELSREGIELLAEDVDTSDPAVRAARDAVVHREQVRNDNVFLFQFPPVMPDLVSARSRAKPDADAPADAQQPAGKQASVKDVEEFKVEDGADPEAAAAAVLADEHAGDNARLNVQPGSVGKLRLHRSGKTTLDWGGTQMLVGLGMGAEFLQTAVIAKMTRMEDSEDGEYEGDAYSMGQVRGKFIVTPDWSDMLR